VDVRSASDELRGRFAHPQGKPSRRGCDAPETLRFSADGRQIASFVEGDGWRVWSLEGEGEEFFAERNAIDELAGFAPPRPRDWFIERGSATHFVHRPSGTHIVLPAAGPWMSNPAVPEIVASDVLHVELRG
jgi:hypothetical protein